MHKVKHEQAPDFRCFGYHKEHAPAGRIFLNKDEFRAAQSKDAGWVDTPAKFEESPVHTPNIEVNACDDPDLQPSVEKKPRKGKRA